MKKLIYVLPALLFFAVGCIGTKNQAPVPIPAGTFTGEFRLLYRKPGQAKIDTTKANLQLVLTSGNYQVLGDTLTVHSGSKGQYAANGTLIVFDDTTFPKTGKPAKTHLVGTYQYYYDGGTILQMVANSGDSLSLQYDLKKAP